MPPVVPTGNTNVASLRKGKVKPKPKPFDPWGPRYKTTTDFESAVKKISATQYQPQLEDIWRERGSEQRASAYRNQQLGQWYGAYGQELSKAFQDTNAALQNLMATRAAGAGAAQGTLNAALRRTGEQTAQEAGVIGGTPTPPPTMPTPEQAGAMQAAYGGQEAQQGALAQTLGGMISESAKNQALAGTGLISAGREERGRLAGLLRNLTEREQTVRNTIPGLVESTRASLLQQALQAASARHDARMAEKEFGLKQRAETQNEAIARGELGLKTRAQTFTEKQGRSQQRLEREKLTHTENLDEAQLQIQRDKLAADIQKTTGTDAADLAKLRAQRWDNGVAYLNNVVAQGKHERQKDFNARVNSGHFAQDIYRTLVGQYRMDEDEALHLMRAAQIEGVRQWAWNRMTRRAANRAYGRSGAATPGTPSGGVR
jgi:hypothetical protein